MPSSRGSLAARLLTLVLLLLGVLLAFWADFPASADSLQIVRVGQGVWYRRYHYNSLYGAQRDVYILDANLNDPEVVVRFPYRTGSAVATVSTFVSGTPRAVG